MINKRIWSTVIIFLITISGINAQTPDVFRLEYMSMPKNKDEVALTRLKIVANVPIKVGKEDNFIIGGEYNKFAYVLDQEVAFDKDVFKDFHVIDLNLAYMYRYNEDWRFIGVVTPRISSTLNEPLQKNDIAMNVTVGALKEKKNIEKPTRLVLGLSYNSTVAFRIPLPVVYFEKRFDPKWTYVIGAPKSALKFYRTEKSVFQTEFILDGYYANLQNNILLPNGNSASAISSSAALITLGYQHTIAKNMFVYGFMGHTLFNNGVLRNEERKESIILNNESSFYFRTGFRIGL